MASVRRPKVSVRIHQPSRAKLKGRYRQINQLFKVCFYSRAYGQEYGSIL